MTSIEEVLARVVAMEGVVVQQRDQITTLEQQLRDARAAAQGAQGAQADDQQRANPIRESLVDTKLLGKPDKFSGELDENAKYKDGVTWENWSFVLSAYCMAVDPHMAELMRDAAKMDAVSFSHEDLMRKRNE